MRATRLSSGWERYATALSTASAFVYATGQIIAAAPTGALKVVDSLGAELSFFGTGADNSTFEVQVGLFDTSKQRDSNAVSPDGPIQLLGVLAITLGASMGPSTSSVIKSTERVADIAAWTQYTNSSTVKGVGAYNESLWAGADAVVYSGGDGSPARVGFRDFGAASHLFLDFKLGTATGAGAIVKRTRQPT